MIRGAYSFSLNSRIFTWIHTLGQSHFECYATGSLTSLLNIAKELLIVCFLLQIASVTAWSLVASFAIFLALKLFICCVPIGCKIMSLFSVKNNMYFLSYYDVHLDQITEVDQEGYQSFGMETTKQRWYFYTYHNGKGQGLDSIKLLYH